ncbi:hypothetical protein ACIHCM_10195 [Streptomyces sp. NPDC052023]|uniref:hypothetical protein n=1 Tax=Streptomyces sp. NPDC052023 TaxID=3365681 RepID=UPI0037D5975B
MVSGAHAAQSVEVTAESLHKDLARLELQKQALERELAAVVAHLGSVQRALNAIDTLMRNPAAELRAEAPSAGPAPEARTANEQAGSGQDAEAPVRSDASADADGNRKYGQLTEQILEYFATAGQADVRARDVAAALGRDTDSGSINAVRSTLDRLVGTSRIRRTGRGLYRAKRT